MIGFMRARTWSLGAVALVFALALFLDGCGARVSATDPTGAPSSRHPDSGIRGRVLIGPTCPVQRVGQTCVRPYRATIVVRSEPAGRLVARARSSADGRFTVALVPGRYVLVPQPGRPYPRSSPQTVTVRSHRYTRVLISYDTGIR